MARNTRIYSDFDLNFLANPATKDVGMKYDANAVKAAVKNLVLTQNYERPFQSAIGTQVYSLLFNPPGPMLDTLLARAIRDVINTYEPRVVLLEVLVNSQVDSNAVDVAITFRIVNTPLPITLELILKRTR
jgi:phage baseplate assembly protein W